MTDSTPSPGTRSHTQAMLVGPNLYLRPVELVDAATAPIWNPRPIPAPVEVVEEQLRERLEVDPDDEESDQLLIACRRDTDEPAGSIRVRVVNGHFAHLYPAADPLSPEPRQDEICAELIGILAPWLLSERNMTSVITDALACWKAVDRKVTELSGRVAAQFRERVLFHGTRRDLIHYQMFEPAWLQRIGAPPAPATGAVNRDVPSPAKPAMAVSESERPSDAFAIGERIYLRPFKPQEGTLVARWMLEETEVYYNEGRMVFNPHSYGHLHKAIAGKEPPAYLRFAIVLRDTGELIGANGLDYIDWVHGTAETETEIFRPQHRNAGLGTEAKHLLLGYAFDRLGLHMIYSFVGEANTRSAAALRKQGYRDAGYAAWITLMPGGMRGYFIFDLLASEWRAARDLAPTVQDSKPA